MASLESVLGNDDPNKAADEPVVTTGLATIEANLPQLRELVLGAVQELAKSQRARKRDSKRERKIEATFNNLIDVITTHDVELVVTTTSLRSKPPIMFSHFTPITWSEGDAKKRKYSYASDCSGELRRLRLRDEENDKFRNAALYGVVNSRDLRYEDKKNGLGRNRWYLHMIGDGIHFYAPVDGLKDIGLGVRKLPPDDPDKPKTPRKH